MEKLLKALTSRTTWTICFMFVFNGFQAIQGFLSPEASLAINGARSLLAAYFKVNPSQDY